MKVTLDFETRSPVDLTGGGVWKYFSHPRTRILCLAVQVDDSKPRIWIPGWVEAVCPALITVFPDALSRAELKAIAEQADIFEAHNAEFERAGWELKMVPDGFPPIPVEKWRCTAAQTGMHALPRALGKVCEALQLPVQKDKAGALVMQRMCKPRKPLKDEDPDGEYWVEDFASFKTLIEYCLQDVRAEASLAKHLDALPPGEQKIWETDQKINARGVQIDVDLAEKACEIGDVWQEILKFELQGVTAGKVSAPTCVQQMIDWAQGEGVHLEDLTKDSVAKALELPLPANVRRALEIRQSAGRTSTAKYSAMLDRVQDDGRARALFMYHVATTGRWGGRSIQPQNMPSRGIITDVDRAVECIKNGMNAAELAFLWNDPLHVLSSCIRGCIVAGPGKDLCVVDYSAIEGRVLAWLVGEQHVLAAYLSGVDLYKLAASGVFDCEIDEVTPEQRQIGKVCELALGYQGGLGAFSIMAKGYGLMLPSEEEVREIIRAWRENRPRTVEFWKDIEAAAIKATTEEGSVVVCGKLLFRKKGRYLRMRLPSGRCLYYPDPRLGSKQTPWGDVVPCLRFAGQDLNQHWVVLDTYGGRLCENAVQAIARDILAEALVRVEASGKYVPVLHVHDEIVSEVDEGKGILMEYTRLLLERPKWAQDLPLEAHGWIGKRYKK